MKVNIFMVFIILVVNVQSFIIGDFRDAMYHIQNGFEKLLSDVVNDMEQTLDCTISAIEHVLIINRILDKTSDFNKKCFEGANTLTFLNTKDVEQRRQIESRVLDKLPESTYKTGNSYSKNILSKDVHSSIENVNRTLHNILIIKSRNETRDDLLEPLRDETNRLSEVSMLLRRELENISFNIKSELEKINFDDESPETLVWDEIKILQKIERESNTSDVNEIHHIVGSALNILKSNNNSNFERSNNQMAKIIKELENSDSNVRSESVPSKDDAHITNNDFMQMSHKENKHILEDKILHNNKFGSKPTDDMSPIFDTFGDSDVEEVMNIINESKFSNLLFENENAGSDIFENVHLFNF